MKSTTMNKPEYIINKIKNEIPYLCIKPSSFDIIMKQLKIYDKLKGKKEADKLIKDALSVQNSGAFSVVLEGIPSKLAKKITRVLDIPTIGIGAGPDCDGQIQVFHDIVGLFNDFVPKHSKQYIDLTKHIKNSLNNYIDDVKNKAFPSKNHYHR